MINELVFIKEWILLKQKTKQQKTKNKEREEKKWPDVKKNNEFDDLFTRTSIGVMGKERISQKGTCVIYLFIIYNFLLIKKANSPYWRSFVIFFHLQYEFFFFFFSSRKRHRFGQGFEKNIDMCAAQMHSATQQKKGTVGGLLSNRWSVQRT